MEVVIRKEKENDYSEVFELVETAFKFAEHTDHKEQFLVEKLRKSNAFIPALSIVAEIDQKIIGYILFTEAKVGGHTLLALAPLAVHPSLHKKGVGSKLVKYGHEIGKQLGYRGSIVLGDHHYYSRFGYTCSVDYKITPPFEVPVENYMTLPFEKDSLDGITGVVEYAPEFFES